MKKNFALSKTYIDKLPIFSYLTNTQRDSISYKMLNLKYADNEVIFKEDDDANSFFIVIEG